MLLFILHNNYEKNNSGFQGIILRKYTVGVEERKEWRDPPPATPFFFFYARNIT